MELDQRAAKRVVEPRPNRGAAQRGEGGQRNNGASKTPSWTTGLVSALLRILHSYPIFRKTNMRANSKSLHYCCYHSQTAIFQAKTHLGMLVYDVYAWTCTGTCILLSSTYLFIDLHVFTHAGLAHCESYAVSQWVQSPLDALPSAITQLGMDLAGQWPLWALVPSPHWCDEGGLCPPHPHTWPQRWGGTQGTRWLASEATFTQLTRQWLAALKMMVPGCLAHCCPLLPCTAGKYSTSSSQVSIFPSLSLLQIFKYYPFCPWEPCDSLHNET